MLVEGFEARSSRSNCAEDIRFLLNFEPKNLLETSRHSVSDYEPKKLLETCSEVESMTSSTSQNVFWVSHWFARKREELFEAL